MAARQCTFSFSDHEGIRHSATVHTSTMEVEAKGPSVTHTVSMRKVNEWLNGARRGPKEKLAKERLNGMLAS